MYSSGTTGLPKGIVHTHRIRAAYATSFATAFRMTPESVTMHAGAIVFNGAFVDLMPTVFTGGTYILLPQFDPEVYIQTILRERVTHVMMVPSQIIAVLNDPSFSADALDSLEMILTLGAPLHREHKERLNHLLPGRFYELYGLTEGFVTVLDKNDYSWKPGSVGAPLPFFEMSIVDPDGRLRPARSGNLRSRPDPHAGILQAPRPDPAGYPGRMVVLRRPRVRGRRRLSLPGRPSEGHDSSGGVNVYPRDIEEVVVQHTAVREAAVFGAPHDKWGETPVAAVVLRQPGRHRAAALKEWINAHVAAKFQRVSDV